MYSGWLFSSRPVELSCVIVASHWTVLTTLLNIFSVLSLCLLEDLILSVLSLCLLEDLILRTWRRLYESWTSEGIVNQPVTVSVIPGASRFVKVIFPCCLPSANIPGWPWYYAHYPTARLVVDWLVMAARAYHAAAPTGHNHESHAGAPSGMSRSSGRYNKCSWSYIFWT